MTHRFIWRSTTIIITLVLIYLAFPILIVPSSLPAIQAAFFSKSAAVTVPSPQPISPDAVPIFQLEPVRQLTFKQKLAVLQQLHRQGINLILNR